MKEEPSRNRAANGNGTISFETVLSSSIYRDREILFAVEPPTGFLHRTRQKNELIMELAPILLRSAVQGIFVYGSPGTGKTALVRSLMSELATEAAKRDVELRQAYVNCSENRTESAILLAVLSKLEPEKSVPKMGWNKARVLEEFHRALARHRQECLLIVLDEVDYVLRESGDDVLYRLSRINESGRAKVSTIVISNDVRVGDYMKPRTASAFGRVKVIFPPYSAAELADILKVRAELALHKDAISEAVIRKVAELEAGRGGDARRALELVDACAKAAIARKRPKISLDLVEEADRAIEENAVLGLITAMPKHQKLVYLAIVKHEKEGIELEGGAVYKAYLELCAAYNIEPLTERRIRSLLVALDEAGLISSEVGWLKAARKKSRKITVNLDAGLKKKAEKLLRDSI